MKHLIQRAFLSYSGARFRAQRRKSPWNLFLLLLSFICIFATWFVLFRAVWAFHVWLYPTHTLRDLGTRGMSSTANLLIFLAFFALFVGSIGAGLILANCLIWLIPPARSTLDAEAKGYPGMGFSDSNKALIKVTAVMLPAGVAVAIVAATLLKSFK